MTKYTDDNRVAFASVLNSAGGRRPSQASPVDKDYHEGMTSLSWKSSTEVQATIERLRLIVKQMLQIGAC